MNPGTAHACRSPRPRVRSGPHDAAAGDGPAGADPSEAGAEPSEAGADLPEAGTGLAAVCRAALTTAGAVRVTVWRRRQGVASLVPEVLVFAAPAGSPGEPADVVPGPALADGLASGRPFVLDDAGALGLAPVPGAVAHCLAVGAAATGEPPAGLVTLEVRPDPGGYPSASAAPAPATTAAVALLAAAAQAWWVQLRPEPSVRPERLEHERTTSGLRQLLEAGVRACSPMEAAEALAQTAITVIGVPTACTYLVDARGMISEVATTGASRERAAALREALIGKPAAGSPVWRRTVEGADRGPDMIPDTAVAGVVRPGGVAEVLGLRSLATIPLLSSEGPLGLILCGGPDPRRGWSQRDREALADLALQGTVVVDNARLREAERHEANHDPLTGLLNRRAFAEHFDRALSSRPARTTLAVLVLDLDRFKEVNDHLGHHVGDQLLIEVAGRLRSSCRSGDVLARLGGDEFAAVVVCGDGDADAIAVSGRIRAALDVPLTLGDVTLRVDVSVGIAVAPEHGDDVGDLLRRADLAMYTAKRSGRGAQVYRAGMRSPTGELGLRADLRDALRRGDGLTLRYQPQVDLARRRVSGVEALVRWDHPVHGLLAPDSFVPLAEETGLIGALTAWVVPTALRQLAAWRAGGHDLRLSVNVSALDVADPTFPESVAAWLADAGVPGTSLVVEVTEGALLHDTARAAATLGRLRCLGVGISLDDFGTGYSALAYLESLPIDEIKTDRQFLHFDGGGGSVLRSIIALGHGLGVRVVAEGVETAGELAWLLGVGCDEAQGYHLARPVEAGAIEELLASTITSVPPPA